MTLIRLLQRGSGKMGKWQLYLLSFLVSTAALTGIYMSKSAEILLLSYILLCITMLARSLYTAATLHRRLGYIIHYIVIVVFQILFTVRLTFEPKHGDIFHFLFPVSVLLIPASVLVEFFFKRKKERQFFMPSVEDFKAVTYAQLLHDKEKIKLALHTVKKAGHALSAERIGQLLEQIHGHSSFHYVNNGSLTDAYFEQAYQHLNDEHIYITLTDSGSPASELISVFTGRKFNHASLSFDADLRTIVSYNGGEKLYPPGMNPEMIAWFYKKKDSSVMIYRLKASREQQIKMIERIRDINREGSAYNLVGLVFKYSMKPNIMFCSQFVCHLLECAGLAYLSKKSTDIKPSDFVELDYKRKLEFVREIRFD